MRDPAAGDRLDQYVLQDLLARSGMASIFKAVDTETGRTVALKIPHIQFESDVVFSERFRREEEILQRLDHPNVIKALTPREKSRTYMAMEYVEGKSLRALLQHGPLRAEEALDIARQLCDALVHLHASGVVHRDLKPENVLVTADGRVKILDFGIALAESARRLTWMGLSNAIGTPDYMAPEQIRGRRGDPRTDVYAVGTMLYEMLTGHLPYERPSPRAMLHAKTAEEPTLPSYWVPGLDPALEAIVTRAIERSPRDRYGTAAEMLADLRNPAAVPARGAEWQRARRRVRARSRRRTALAAAVVAIVLVLAALAWLTARYSAPPRPAPASHRSG